MEELKQRHGCVTCWLWLVLVVNAFITVVFIFNMFETALHQAPISEGVLAMLSTCNVFASLLLMKWNKTGFYIFIVSTVLTLLVSLFKLNANLTGSLYSIVGIAIWWAMLQIKHNGVTAWSMMSDGLDFDRCRNVYLAFVSTLSFQLLLLLFAMLIWPKIYNADEAPISYADESPIEVSADETATDPLEVYDEDSDASDEMDSVAYVVEESEPAVSSTPAVSSNTKRAAEDNASRESREALETLRQGIKEIALPINAGSGVTITEIYLTDNNLVYVALCDENLVNIEALNQAKAQVKQGILSSATASSEARSIIELCIKAKRGMLYIYKGDTSGKTCRVQITTSELSKAL